MFKNFRKNKYNSGFTLIELLVVISIFMIITTITIFSYGRFNSSVSIQNLADDIALSVRRAQSYAIGVQGVSVSGSGYFNDGYGIHFTANSVIAGEEYKGSNKSFVLFADIGDNKKYEYGSTGECGTPSIDNECMEVLNIISNDQIRSISLTIGSNIIPINSGSTVDVLFKRPNSEPKFCYRIDANSVNCYEESSISSISSISIRVENITNPEIFKIITISNNGQISVLNK